MTIYDVAKIKCRTFIESINTLFSMGKELEQEVDDIETSVGTSADEASSSGSLWARIKYALANMVSTSGAQTIADVKTFTSSPVIPTTPASIESAVNQAYVESTVDGVNNIVHKSGDETIAGTKTFSKIIDGHAIRGGLVGGTNNRSGWVKAAKFGVPVNYRNFTVTIMSDRYRISSQFVRLNIYCGSTPKLYIVDAYGSTSGAIDPLNYGIGIVDGEVTLWYNKINSDMGYWINIEKSASYGSESILPFTILNTDATDPSQDETVTEYSNAVIYDYKV
jgi:hypothetical protein